MVSPLTSLPVKCISFIYGSTLTSRTYFVVLPGLMLLCLCPSAKCTVPLLINSPAPSSSREGNRDFAD